jgi:hypothetical protein
MPPFDQPKCGNLNSAVENSKEIRCWLPHIKIIMMLPVGILETD